MKSVKTRGRASRLRRALISTSTHGKICQCLDELNSFNTVSVTHSSQWRKSAAHNELIVDFSKTVSILEKSQNMSLSGPSGLTSHQLWLHPWAQAAFLWWNYFKSTSMNTLCDYSANNHQHKTWTTRTENINSVNQSVSQSIRDLHKRNLFYQWILLVLQISSSSDCPFIQHFTTV